MVGTESNGGVEEVGAMKDFYMVRRGQGEDVWLSQGNGRNGGRGGSEEVGGKEEEPTGVMCMSGDRV